MGGHMRRSWTFWMQDQMEKRRKNRIIMSRRYSDTRFRWKKTGSSQNVCNALLNSWQVPWLPAGLAITYKMQLQLPTKSFCNFMQKGLAKNTKDTRFFTASNFLKRENRVFYHLRLQSAFRPGYWQKLRLFSCTFHFYLVK